MSRVPKLDLDMDVHSAKIHVRCDGISKMQTENDLEYMAAVYSAKKDFNLRTDIIYFITSEDLMRIQTCEHAVQLRIVPEPIHKQRSPKHSPSRRESKRSNSDSSSSRTITRNPNVTSRVVLISGHMYSISFIDSVSTYSLFVLEDKKQDKLFCYGTKDHNIKCDSLGGFMDSTVSIGATFSVFASCLNPIVFPLYFSIVSDHSYTAEQFIDLITKIIDSI